MRKPKPNEVVRGRITGAVTLPITAYHKALRQQQSWELCGIQGWWALNLHSFQWMSPIPCLTQRLLTSSPENHFCWHDLSRNQHPGLIARSSHNGILHAGLLTIKMFPHSGCRPWWRPKASNNQTPFLKQCPQKESRNPVHRSIRT